MDFLENPVLWISGIILILSASGVIIAKKPVHATLSFMLTLVTLSSIYLHLEAPFIAVMQVWVYAGAILVIFMFVIVLFQDAHKQIEKYHTRTYPLFLISACIVFVLLMIMEGNRLLNLSAVKEPVQAGYGTVQSIGKELYMDFFFPFEAVVLLFMVSIVGAVYIGKKEK